MRVLKKESKDETKIRDITPCNIIYAIFGRDLECFFEIL